MTAETRGGRELGEGVLSGQPVSLDLGRERRARGGWLSLEMCSGQNPETGCPCEIDRCHRGG